jgi:YD repeat-containing protein
VGSAGIGGRRTDPIMPAFRLAQVIAMACSKTGRLPESSWDHATEIKNQGGERLSIKRDTDGNILRITLPHGHFVALTNDSAGRITRVEDNANRWVIYQYDSVGAWVKSRNWSGDAQDFTYDARFNMTRVEESGTDREGSYRFTINNTFDGQNRLRGQTVSTGAVFSVQYFTDDKDNIVQADVRDLEGLSRYFFDELGYDTREEFKRVKGPGWTFERVRDLNSNVITEVVLRCQSVTIKLPAEFDVALGEDGDSRIEYLSAACKKAESEAQANKKRTSPRGHS